MIGKNLSKMQECTFQWSNIQPNNRNNVPRAYQSIPSTRPGSSHRSNDTPAPGGNLWKKPLLRPSGSRNREAVSSPFDRCREEEKKRRGRGRRRRREAGTRLKVEGPEAIVRQPFTPFQVATISINDTSPPTCRTNCQRPSSIRCGPSVPPLHPRGNFQFLSFVAVFTLAATPRNVFDGRSITGRVDPRVISSWDRSRAD